MPDKVNYTDGQIEDVMIANYPTLMTMMNALREPMSMSPGVYRDIVMHDIHIIYAECKSAAIYFDGRGRPIPRSRFCGLLMKRKRSCASMTTGRAGKISACKIYTLAYRKRSANLIAK